MTQFDFGAIDPGTTSGAELAEMLGDFRDAIHTCHKGSNRPAYAVVGTLWVKTASPEWSLYMFDGSSDVHLFYINPSTHKIRLKDKVTDSDKLDGLHATSFLRSDAANNRIRMGSDVAADGSGNFDGIEYDDSTNEFTFKSDGTVNLNFSNSGVFWKGFDIWHSGNLDDAPFMRTDANNPKLRMGSDSAGNFDGFLYDEAGNTFVLVADGPDDGTSVGSSQLHLGKIRLKHTSDVSGTSTGHPFEIGVPGNRMMMDTNEIGWDHGDGFKAIGFGEMVGNVRLTGRTYLNPANDAVTYRFGSGRVCTAVRAGTGADIYAVEHCQMQIWKNDIWVNVSGN